MSRFDAWENEMHRAHYGFCLSACDHASCRGEDDVPEHVSSILPRALASIRGPSRRTSMAPLVDSQCSRCRTIWRAEARESLCPSCRAEERS